MHAEIAIDPHSLIDSHEAPFVLIDADYRIVAANSAYCDSHSVDCSEVLGRRCHEVSHHSPTPCFEHGEDCPHQRVFLTGAPYEVVHVHYDGLNRPEFVRLRGYPVKGSDGRLFLGELISPLPSKEGLACDEMRMVGRSPAFLKCVDRLSRLADSEAPILLYGESGVGKELAARFVHDHSPRSSGPFVAFNCAAVPEAMFESEFFGHEKGAFTGCMGRKPGILEQANGGTLFLDEVGEIPLAIQPKLLRALESGEYRRLGGTQALMGDVRLVSATNRDLLEMVDQKTFRQDLYYRVAGLDVVLPTLRERREDIPELAQALLDRLGAHSGPTCRLGKDAMALLLEYDFPGNVRELRNIVYKAATLSGGGLIRATHIRLRGALLPPAAAPFVPANPERIAERSAEPGEESLADMELRKIRELLERFEGHRRRVADALGISERTLYRKLRRFGM